jgi:flagellar hook assembly protein FlgD
VHGQLVRRMVAPEQVTGPEGEIALQWEWDGLDDRGLPVPSGVYLVSMNAGAQRFMGKLIKLR